MTTLPLPVAEALTERRIALRISVERAATLWAGFRRIRCQMLDLSLTGCRLRCPEPIHGGHTALWLWLPSGLGGRFGHPLRSEVAWSDSIPDEPTGVCDLALRFVEPGPWGTRRLEAAVQSLLVGESERRRGERVAYPRHVVSRTAQGPRVLLGRDLSPSGMSVDGAQLEVGEELELALHTGGKLAPLVVHARIVRKGEGDEAGLSFFGLNDDQRDYLERLIAEPAPLRDPCNQPVVVSEVLG